MISPGDLIRFVTSHDTRPYVLLSVKREGVSAASGRMYSVVTFMTAGYILKSRGGFWDDEGTSIVANGTRGDTDGTA